MVRWKRDCCAIGFMLFCCLFPMGLAKKVVLLDTTESANELKWNTYSATAGTEDGWLEETYTNLDQDSASLSVGNYRAYVVCEVDQDRVDNWLRTPFVDRGNANRLYIEVSFTMRDCKQFPHTARTCKETFTLLYHEADHDFPEGSRNSWSTDSYRLLDRIAADSGRFTNNNQPMKLNTEIRSIPLTKKGVFFTFRDEGGCTSIVAVKIYYEVCEETVAHFAWFPETPTGQEMTSIQESVGHCVDAAGAISGGRPTYLCKADGTWDRLSGGCQCRVGYWPEGNDRCIACDPGTFKDYPGLGRCRKCPEHSNSRVEASESCECDAGYYRGRNDAKSAPCTQPPDRPVNAKVLVNQDEAIITWSSPSRTGGRKELWYRVLCQTCPPSTQYSPANRNRLNRTEIRMKSLIPDSIYSVLIYAENEVSEQLHQSMYTVVEVRVPKLAPFLVRNFRVLSSTESQISLAWRAPEIPVDYSETDRADSVPLLGMGDQKDLDNRIPGTFQRVEPSVQRSRSLDVRRYEIRYYPLDAPVNSSVVQTAQKELTVQNLKPDREYLFQVRAFTAHKGWGAWGDILRTRTGRSTLSGAKEKIGNSSDGAQTATVFILAVVGIGLVFLLVIFLIYLRRRRSSGGCHKKQPSDLDALEYDKNTGNITPDYNHMQYHPSNTTLSRKITAPLMPQFVNPAMGYKPYVDPLAYEDPNEALKEFAGEIDASFVIIEEIIGGGEFGEVCKGKLKIPARPEETVAIKTLKPGSSEKAKADFLAEASIMGQFDHENVIKLKGVVTRSEPVMIITEYMENRSLDSFLKAHDGKLDPLQLTGMLSGIAAGMKYLSDKGYVHRDLAARNVLVDGNLRCKIADFGLSRGLEGREEQVYTTKGGKIPVRWTAPEAIAYRKFTSASDVWSFGVMMWEVMSFGERPYWEWTNQEVIQKIERGYRLPAPMDCPPALHQLMEECWQNDRIQRPNFGTILNTLWGFLQCPDLLYTANTNSTISTPIGAQSQSAVSLTSLNVLPVRGVYPQNGPHMPSSYQMSMEEFLSKIGMSHVHRFLYERGVLTLSSLARLTMVDLMNYGLSFEESQRLLEAAQRVQMATMPRRAPNRTGQSYEMAPNGSCQRSGYQTVGQSNQQGFFV